MQTLDIILRIFGAFYVLAGIVLARTVLTSRLLDQALAAITLSRVDPKEQLKERYSLVLACLTFTSGLALLCLSSTAVWLFLAGAIAQAAFIYWIAPRYVDAPEDGASLGRQQSTNAFVIYSAIAALVAWSAHIGRLKAWAELSDITVSAAAATLVAFAGYLIWAHVKTTLPRSRATRDLPAVAPDSDNESRK